MRKPLVVAVVLLALAAVTVVFLERAGRTMSAIVFEGLVVEPPESGGDHG